MISAETRVGDLSLGELLNALRGVTIQEPEPQPAPQPRKAMEYGIGGIMRIFNCSRTQANRIKQSGMIDGAIRQVGRLIVTDPEKALELWGAVKKKPKYKY